MISVKGLSVSYDRKRVLSNIFLDIEPGHIYGVLGPNGAGKSTLFKSILGLLEPNAGQIEVFGLPVSASRKRVAYVPQKNEVDWQFPASVFDVAMMGRYPFRRVFERLSKKDEEIALAALREVGMESFKNRQLGELSGGQQQRVFIARALAQQADVFLLDEPFVGVDVTTEDRIIQILKKLSAEGKTLLVVHHDLSSVKNYFDRVILINQRLIAAGDLPTAFTDANVALTYGGQLEILQKTERLETARR